MIRSIKQFAWYHWLGGIFLLFILATTIFPYFPDSRWKWFVLYNFTLSAEMNLAAWLSGISLLTLALLAYEISSQESIKAKGSWRILALIFFGLYADEISSFHERLIGDWRSVIPYLLVGLVLFGYTFLPLFNDKHTRKTAVFILLGFSLFGLVAIQEIIEHALNWPDWALGLRVGLEEGTELVGFFLCFWGVIHQRKKYLSSNTFTILVPNPLTMKQLALLLSGGLFLHLLTLLVIPDLTDIGLRGNPAILYPTTIFLMIAAATFWQNSHDENKSSFWMPLALYSLTCSAAAFYLTHLLFKTDVWVPDIIILVVPVIFLWRTLIPITAKDKYLILLAVLLLTLVLATVFHSQLEPSKATLFGLLANLTFFSQLALLALFYINTLHQLTNSHLLILLFFAFGWLTGFMLSSLVTQFLIFGLFCYVIGRWFLLSPKLFNVAAG